MFYSRELKAQENSYNSIFISLKLNNFDKIEKIKSLSTDSVPTRLTVRQGDKTPFPPALTQALLTNTTLTGLDLSGCGIEYVELGKLCGISALTSLNLSDWALGDVGSINPSLTFLNVDDNGVGPEEAQVLAKHTSLTRLSIMQNQLGDKGAKALFKSTTLTYLNLEGNDISAQGVLELSANTSLTSLKLRNNQIGDEGVKSFYPANTTLTKLNLELADIEEEGARVLGICNNTLTALNLGENCINSKGYQALFTNTALKSLKLGSTPDNEALDALFINTTLTRLGVDGHAVNNRNYEKFPPIIQENKHQLMIRGQNFLRFLVILAKDKYKSYDISQSPFAQLPKEIISLIAGLLYLDIGKQRQQIKNFLDFFFSEVPTILTSLKEGKKIHIIESIPKFRLAKKFRLAEIKPPMALKENSVASEENSAGTEENSVASEENNLILLDEDNFDPSIFFNSDEFELESTAVASKHSSVSGSLITPSPIPFLENKDISNSSSTTSDNVNLGEINNHDRPTKTSYAVISQFLRLSGESKIPIEVENKNDAHGNENELPNTQDIVRSHTAQPSVTPLMNSIINNDDDEVKVTEQGFGKN